MANLVRLLVPNFRVISHILFSCTVLRPIFAGYICIVCCLNQHVLLWNLHLLLCWWPKRHLCWPNYHVCSMNFLKFESTFSMVSNSSLPGAPTCRAAQRDRAVSRASMAGDDEKGENQLSLLAAFWIKLWWWNMVKLSWNCHETVMKPPKRSLAFLFVNEISWWRLPLLSHSNWNSPPYYTAAVARDARAWVHMLEKKSRACLPALNWYFNVWWK